MIPKESVNNSNLHKYPISTPLPARHHPIHKSKINTNSKAIHLIQLRETTNSNVK